MKPRGISDQGMKRIATHQKNSQGWLDNYFKHYFQRHPERGGDRTFINWTVDPSNPDGYWADAGTWGYDAHKTEGSLSHLY